MEGVGVHLVGVVFFYFLLNEETEVQDEKIRFNSIRFSRKLESNCPELSLNPLMYTDQGA
jgi:hypothetical protein